MPLPVFKELDVLYKEAKKCDFTVKKNFPHTLKPIFSDCVSSAMDYQVLNPNFWSHITSILPYNSFTMKVGDIFSNNACLEINFSTSISGQNGKFEQRNPSCLQ